jgi:hypothetical protein
MFWCRFFSTESLNTVLIRGCCHFVTHDATKISNVTAMSPTGIHHLMTAVQCSMIKPQDRHYHSLLKARNNYVETVLKQRRPEEEESSNQGLRIDSTNQCYRLELFHGEHV